MALDLSCDDNLFLLEHFKDEIELDYNLINNPILSDSCYALGLHFQEALMASLITSQNPPNIPQETEHPIFEIGQSSLTFCEICTERKENDQFFTIQNCNHFFCNDCVTKHVETKVIFDNFHVVKCPAVDCKSVLESNSCVPIMPKIILDKWDEVVCRSMILDSQIFYCPYKNCSAMMVRDTGDEAVRESVCPECHRLFCAECRVSWHSGIECGEFQKLNEDERGREDLMLMDLAKEKNWKRCPKCKFYVEKTEGCLHMTCRCKFEFCYACGGTWSSTHGGCQ